MTVPTQERPSQERPTQDRPAEEGLADAGEADDRLIDDCPTDDRPTEEHVAACLPQDPPVAEAPARDLPVRRPLIDPRIRERRIEVLREAGRRRLRVTLVIASTIVVLGLGYLAIHSPLLAVDHIRIAGTHREPVNVVMHAAGVHNGEPLVFVNTGAIERRLEQLQWIATARVRRVFPGTLTIEVSEYKPTAYVPMTGRRVALIASNGRVVGLSRSVPPHAVELLGERLTPVVGAVLSPQPAANVLSQLPPHLRSRVGAIDVGGDSAVLDLRTVAPAPGACRPVAGAVTGFAQIRLGSLDQLRDKGVAALSVLNSLAGRPFTYIDVSVPQEPVAC